jgi:uncharacterized Zn finger protein (UPF0148 family)
MTKYTIEGNINFYEELYKSLDEAEDKNDDSACLITNLPLTNYHISLECGHKFNYEPLYNDILNHKTKFNTMERCLLKTNEIRCPYCRTVQKTLLPYYEELGLQKIHGVNYIDEIKQIHEYSCMNSGCKWETGICCFEVFDLTKNSIAQCDNTQVVLVEPTGKKYCQYHRYTAQKQFIAKKKLELRQKQKLEKMNAKLNAKMEAKKEKELAKENAKKQKLEDKIKNKISYSLGENIIVSSTNSMNQCNQIFKTGKNKGKNCGCKVFKDALCTRHYNLANKNNNIETTENEKEIVL